MIKIYDILNFKKIAIIQTAFLGDIALALYFADTIKEINPNCELTFITNPIAFELLRSSPKIDRIIAFDKRAIDSGLKGIRRLSNILKKEKIDCIFGLQRSLRTTLVSFLANPKLSIGFDNSTLSVLYKKRVKYILGLHEIQRNNKLLENLLQDEFERKIITKTRWGVDLEINEEIIKKIDFQLKSFGIQNSDELIAIAPGSVWETKRWPEDYFIDLIKKLLKSGFTPFLIGSKNEVELCNRISLATNCNSLAGQTTILELLEILKRCQLTITNDSAPTHLAGLVKCKTITIFGSTIPEFGFSPLGPNDLTIGNDNLKCRPCGIHGSKKCPIKSFDCMKTITPETVFDYVLKVINSE